MATETWVLNDSGGFDSLEHIEVAFNSNNSTFYGIRSDTMKLYYYTDDTNKREVFNSTGDGWTNTAYRTITFETAPTGGLLTWLQANGTKQASVERVSVDLATAFPDKWAALTPGEHTIQIRAKNPGNYLDSDLSTAKTFMKVVNWTINITATNCTADASNPTVVPSNTTAENPVILKFNKATGYTLPTSVVLDGIADDGYTWAVSSDGAVGTITIIAPTGNITGTITGVAEIYNITTNLTHATKESGPSTIAYGASATLKFSFPTGYEAPASVTVTGADSSWEAGTGTLTLMKARGPVTVTLVGVATTTTIDGGTYKWHDNASLTEWIQEINFTSNGTSYTAMRYTGNGTAMTLQYRYGGSDWVTAYNYDEDASTGSWVNDAYKIVDLGTSAQTVTAIFKADFVANTTKLTQLTTPQNVSADGTVVSWDEVENATSYDILADGVSIGTVENQNGYSVALTCDGAGRVSFNYSIDNMSADLIIQPGETKNIIVTEYLFIRGRGATPEVVSYSGGVLEASGGFGRWTFTPTQNNATITVVDND